MGPFLPVPLDGWRLWDGIYSTAISSQALTAVGALVSRRNQHTHLAERNGAKFESRNNDPRTVITHDHGRRMLIHHLHLRLLFALGYLICSVLIAYLRAGSSFEAFWRALMRILLKSHPGPPNHYRSQAGSKLKLKAFARDITCAYALPIPFLP